MELGKSNRLNLAIISPNDHALTETFIEAHELYINANIYFYHGKKFPVFVSGKNITLKSFWKKDLRIIREKIFGSFDLSEMESDLLKSFKKNNIDAVLAEYGMSGVWVLNVCKKLNIPLYVHFHGLDAHNTDIIKKLGNAYKEMFDYAKKIFSVSNFMSEKLVELGCSKEKILLNTYGPREEFFNVTPSYQSANLLYIGRFVDKKVPYYLILAFKQLVVDYPKAKLIMVGDGPLYETCINLVRFYKLDSNVDFIGQADRAKILELMGISCGYIQHSVIASNGDTEGTPLSILEASAAALPVIATRHAGIEDVIIDKETGFLIEEHDVEGMISRMKHLLDISSVEKEKIGLSARKRIRDNFNIQKHIKNIEESIL